MPPDGNKKYMPTAADFGRPPTTRERRPAVVFQPHTYHKLRAGVDLLAAAVRPTLGPLPRMVAVSRTLRTDAPEMLDDGAVIARRMIALGDRSQDVGAMLLRNAMWQMHEQAGDGATTMAVILQSILAQGIHAVSAGECDAMQLRRALDGTLECVLYALHQQARPLQGRENIARVAHTVCPDPELANMLGEVFDIVGAEGTVNVQEYPRPGVEREYIEGTYWSASGLCSPLMETDSIQHRALLDDAHILISDASVQEPAQLVPLLERVIEAKIPNLVLIALNFSGRALGLVLYNKQAGVLNVFAVRAPKYDALEQVSALQDIALLTGGRFVSSAAGETLERVQVSDLGRARRAWATDEYFGIAGGKGDGCAIRKEIATLRARLNRAENANKEPLEPRLGHLTGGVAILRVGAATAIESKSRKELAERAARAMRSAVNAGVVPGGGTALLNCQEALVPERASDSAMQVACRILHRALEEPLRVIALNAGYSPERVVARVSSSAQTNGFDARTGELTEMHEAGIVDPVRVLEQALRVAVSGAGIALTTEVIVHRKRPPESMEP